jgi:hypothetical protein
MSTSRNLSEIDPLTRALEAETTLRLIAKLPVPEGLEERVKAGLRSAPTQARIIAWPFSSADGGRWIHGAGMRAAAAAAIVFVVAGGGWEIYSHIQLAPLPTAVSVPQPLNGGSAFHAAGAKRVPQTLEGPVVATPVIAAEKQKAEATKAISPKHGKRPATKKTAPPAEVR